MAARQEKRLQKGLRQLRAGAIKGQAVFFKTIAPWLLTSNRPYNPLPPLAKVKALLPCFAGDPPWSLTEGVALLNAAIPHPQVFRSAQPTWEQFQPLLHRPMSKASGPDGVPPTCCTSCHQISNGTYSKGFYMYGTPRKSPSNGYNLGSHCCTRKGTQMRQKTIDQSPLQRPCT